MKQLAIDFDASLRERFPEFMDCVRASVHGCGRPFKAIAADLDMAPSELSRKLSENPNDPVHFQLRHLPALLKATKSLDPLYWLVDQFCESPDDKARRAKAQLIAKMPEILALLQEAGQ